MRLRLPIKTSVSLRVWLGRLNLGFPGDLAERYLLEAMNRLGYVVVNYTNYGMASTIRKTGWREEEETIDFMVTTKLEGRVVPIPLQVTIAGNFYSSKFRKKLRLAQAGKIALLAPGEAFPAKSLFNLMKEAADGKPQALRNLRERLDIIFCEYHRLASRKN